MVPIEADSSDSGMFAMSRRRSYVVLLHKRRTLLLMHPAWAYQQLAQSVARQCQCSCPSDLFFLSHTEVAAALAPLAARRGVPMADAALDWRLLLTMEERRRLAEFERCLGRAWRHFSPKLLPCLSVAFRQIFHLVVFTSSVPCSYICVRTWLATFGYPASSSDFCVFNLSDNPSARLTWSAASGRVPCPRTNGGKLFSPKKRRWLLPVEQLAAFGVPTQNHHCFLASVRPFLHAGEKAEHMIGALAAPAYVSHILWPVRPRVASVIVASAGNMMHVPSVGLVLLAALISVSLLSDMGGEESSTSSEEV